MKTKIKKEVSIKNKKASFNFIFSSAEPACLETMN